MWAYLDTGSAKNFVSRDAVIKLHMKPERHEQREIVTLNRVTKQSMPIYKIKINGLNLWEAQEEIDVTGFKDKYFPLNMHIFRVICSEE